MPTAIQSESDETLAARAADGCRHAFAALVERHYDRIYRLAWRLVGSRDRAEDIAQEVCVKLATAIRSFRGDAKLSTWIHRVAYTTAVDYLRVHQRTVALSPSDMVQLVDATADTGAAPDEDDGIWQAVRELPPQQRDAILLVYAEEMSHAEAAAILECSEKTVSWHIHEAKKKLKIMLKAAG